MGITVDFDEDGCALMTMRNGQNRLNLSTLKQINDALDLVERNVSCKILITTGEGKFFCNGIDLAWVKSQSANAIKEFEKQLEDTMWRITFFPIPTVAAINGHAFAGGAFLVASHDYSVMNSEKGWICWNEVLIYDETNSAGLAQNTSPFNLIELLRLKYTSHAIRESLLYAKRLTGQEATKLKIVDTTTTAENLISESKRLGFGALGRNKIGREALQDMKRKAMLRNKNESKL